MASSSNSVLRMISCLRAAMEEENTEGEMIERRVDRKNKSTTNFFKKNKIFFLLWVDMRPRHLPKSQENFFALHF